MTANNPEFSTELRKHVLYLISKLAAFEDQTVDEQHMRAVLRDFNDNIAQLCGWGAAGATAAAQPAGARAPAFSYVGGGRCITQLPFGTLCFLGQNLDVSPAFWRDGGIEPWVTRLVRELLRPGDSYINIGANFGYYTVLGASLVGASGRVISVEANPRIFDCLVRSVMYSGFSDRTRLHNIAVSDSTGDTLNFQVNPPFSGGGSVGLQQHRDARAAGLHVVDAWEEGDLMHPAYRGEHGLLEFANFPVLNFDVQTCTLDDLWRQAGAPRVDVLQMDIEGAEFIALSGAQDMLRAHPGLHIVTEIAPLNWDVGARREGALRKVMAALEHTGHRVCRLLPVTDRIQLKPIDLLASINAIEHGDYVLLPPQSTLERFLDLT